MKKITKQMINKIINQNYSVFKGFDVADGTISLKDYLKHMTNKFLGGKEVKNNENNLLQV